MPVCLSEIRGGSVAVGPQARGETDGHFARGLLLLLNVLKGTLWVALEGTGH